MKSLVAYFSATGTTEKVAKNLAKATNSDLFEIVPKQKYTDEDLDWTNQNSRSSIEMKNTSSRPEIASKIDNLKDYNCLFLGFPIWWYREPSIIDTFLEQYDFSNIKIIPFATSGGSGMGHIKENLQALAKNAIVENGKRFSSNTIIAELKSWGEQFSY